MHNEPSSLSCETTEAGRKLALGKVFQVELEPWQPVECESVSFHVVGRRRRLAHIGH